MPEFDVTLILHVSIPVVADDADAAIDVAHGDALDQKLADGSFIVVDHHTELLENLR